MKNICFILQFFFSSSATGKKEGSWNPAQRDAVFLKCDTVLFLCEWQFNSMMCYSVMNKLSGNILVKKLCLWYLCLFIPYVNWNWPFLTCLSEMLFPFCAIQNYTSTMYLTLPVLKQEEKCSAWNRSVIYPTFHPSSATKLQITKLRNAHPTYIYISFGMPE